MLEKSLLLEIIVILMVLLLPLLAYACGWLNANLKGWWWALSVFPSLYLGALYTFVTGAGVYGLLKVVYEVDYSITHAAATLVVASAMFFYVAGFGLLDKRPLTKAIGGEPKKV